MTDPRQVLRYPQVVAEGLDDWRFFLGRLHTRFHTGSFTRGLELVTRITAAAEEADHHPDVVLTYPQVDVDLHSHDVHGVTSRDIALARRISEIAAELGIEAAPRDVSTLELALDVPDAGAVQPFWRAVLGYAEGDPDGSAAPVLSDPTAHGPGFWVQQMGAPRPQRNRIHVDVTVPHDVAEARVTAAIAAGGHLVSDERAPAFWVLADAECNEACVCTWQARD